MTASRRYLPASLACLISLSAASAGLAAGGGSALDPYSNIQAPTSLKGSGKNEKGKKNHHVPITKKAQVAEEKIVQDDSTQSQTYVKLPGGGKSKRQKETALAPEPKAEPKPVFKKAKALPVKTATKVSDLAPAPKEQKAAAKEQKAAVATKSDDSVMGGIKTIGEGYSKTFKAASHSMVHSTKAASDAVLAGSKKVGSGIKSGAKASGEVFKKGADIVGQGFKATGDKIKEGAAPLTHKLAKAPAAAPKEEKIANEKPKELNVAHETPIRDEKPKAEKQGLGAKLAHLPKPKMPKIGIPFIGGKKKPAVVDQQAGASEQGPQATDTNVAVAPKQAPLKKAKKETPIVDDPPKTARVPSDPKAKTKSSNPLVSAEQSLVAMPGNVTKKLGKLWPWGHKDAPSDVAGKQTPAPM